MEVGDRPGRRRRVASPRKQVVGEDRQLRQSPVHSTSGQTPERLAPENPPPHPGSRAPAEPLRLAEAGSPRATCAHSTRGSVACPPPHLSPRLPGASSSSSAAEAARNAALHALRAAALRCALQPGEARVSADLGPSSPGSHGRASEQGEETGPCAVRRPASSRSPRPAPAPPLTC